MNRHTFGSAVLGVVLVAITGCFSIDQEMPVRSGDQVTIQFRRDALGAAMSAPPTSHNVRGAAVSVDGVVKETRPGWILVSLTDPIELEHGDLQPTPTWIPLSSILMIQTR